MIEETLYPPMILASSGKSPITIKELCDDPQKANENQQQIITPIKRSGIYNSTLNKTENNVTNDSIILRNDYTTRTSIDINITETKKRGILK